jgi:hypothetical protein
MATKKLANGHRLSARRRGGDEFCADSHVIKGQIGDAFRIGSGLRERQIRRRILRNDLARRLAVNPGNQALKFRQLGQCTLSLSDPASRI